MRTIANNGDSALARARALCRTVRHTVHKEYGITRIELNLNRGFNAIERAIAAGTFGIVERGMKQIGFVRTGDRHRRPIAIANIAKRKQNIDLPTPKLIVVKAKLRAHTPFVSAGMHARSSALIPNVYE